MGDFMTDNVFDDLEAILVNMLKAVQSHIVTREADSLLSCLSRPISTEPEPPLCIIESKGPPKLLKWFSQHLPTQLVHEVKGVDLGLFQSFLL